MEEPQEYNSKEQQKELLKEYFLYSCLYKANQNKEIDISAAVYFDLSNYSIDVFKQIDDYAKQFVDSIPESPNIDLNNGRAVLMHSLEKYKSKELDLFIENLDKSETK
jgi:hypothetical protein